MAIKQSKETKMAKKNVVFLGAKNVGYQCLQYLINMQATYNYEVIAVLTNDAVVLKSPEKIETLAAENNIKLLQHPNELLELKEPVDILYSVQYHKILLPTQIEVATQIAVNLHMAPLPDYRGCNQFSFAILDNAKEFGTTIHQLTAGIDSGPILFEHRFDIAKNSWVAALYNKTMQSAIALFKSTLPHIINMEYTPKPQNLFTDRPKNFHLRNEIEGIKQIDLDWPKEKIERHIRATYFEAFEPPYAFVNHEKMYLTPSFKTT
jgi:methionyl-tRNA formyltransferase